MDKYTVDLDKVLNDFEYNELTIEQDNLAISSTSQSIPPAYPLGSRLKGTGSTKHSINTVFKSLDDYINSDISASKSDVPEYSLKEDIKPFLVPVESRLLVDVSSKGDDLPSVSLPVFADVDNGITEGLNLEISSQEEIVFDKKTALEDMEVDNSDSESTESVYLDMSGGGKNVILNNNFEANTPVALDQRKENQNAEPKPVGFDNTLDIDDSELSQYLEDLEKEVGLSKVEEHIELQRKFVENEVKVVQDFKIEVADTEKSSRTTKERRDSLQDRPNSLDIVNNLVPTRECINLIGQPGSTPYNNVYVSKQLNSSKAGDFTDENVILEVVRTDPVEENEKAIDDLPSAISITESIQSTTYNDLPPTISIPTTTSASTTAPTPLIASNPSPISHPTTTNDGDNISCDSSISISSSSASSSAMSPTFSEASTNSVQSTDETPKHKSKSKEKSSKKPSDVVVDTRDQREEDAERLLSLDLDDSIDEQEQLEQEEMLLEEDSSRSEEIALVDEGNCTGEQGKSKEEEEISAMDFIAETATPNQPVLIQNTPQPQSSLKSLTNNNNNNSNPDLQAATSIIEQVQRNKESTQQHEPQNLPKDIPQTTEEASLHTLVQFPEQDNNNSSRTSTHLQQESESFAVNSGLSDDSSLSIQSNPGLETLPGNSQSGASSVVAESVFASSPSLDEATAAANSWLGKEQPIWIPDTEALNCLHCDMKFTVIKRRHHCRACGLVLCSRCCNSKFRLEYLNNREARVCAKCHEILLILYPSTSAVTTPSSSAQLITSTPPTDNLSNHNVRQPNPNNPMDYCSTVPPPLQQQSGSGGNGSGAAGTSGGVPSVMVPVGVLKRNGSTSGSKKSSKSVMFCDGIRPGSDLTNLDQDFNYNMTTSSSGRRSPGAGSNTSSEGTIGSTSGEGGSPQSAQLMVLSTSGGHKPLARQCGGGNQPEIDKGSKSFIPASVNGLPPKVTVYKSDISYSECSNSPGLLETLRNETVTFAIQKNLYANVKIVNMSCCINKIAWCFSTEGLMSVGQDEILILIETMENETTVPKDVFYHLNDIYLDAVKGQTVAELGVSLHNNSNFLESKSHVGFLYIRPTFQCLHNLIIPKESYLVGILIHRWETPWAKVFPLRLVLRLGAEYRYYPSPIISTRHRDSVFVEIGHTIINILADFRNFSYSLPHIRGLSILMEEKKTTINIPVNRYDQVMKTLNNSSEHILAFGGNFSSQADSHLVCIQNKNGTSENTYTTHAININNKPRKITGASYIVFNGALKSTSGLTAKSSIVEDGLMIQIHPEDMVKLRDSLRQMRGRVIRCGPVQPPSPANGGSGDGTAAAATTIASEETVVLKWGEADVCFNVGVKSLIDDTSMSGIPSIRVHQGKDFVCNSGSRFIRWTEVFILQNGEENNKSSEPVDVSKVASDIARATCTALVKYLDLLASNNFYKVGIRTNLHIENVSYSAGSNGIKLPPIYMKSLDNELIPVLHRITASNSYASAVVLELVFRILNAGGDSAVPQHLTL